MKAEIKDNIVRIRKPRTKMDRQMAVFPIVLYEVTGNFGMSPIGQIREARLIVKDGYQGLIYHPSDRTGPGCFEMVERSREIWISTKKYSYVNV